jgi:hypothetical protein
MSRSALRAEAGGLALLACALVFGAIALRAEPRIGRVPLNDAVFHLAAAERLGESVCRGEPWSPARLVGTNGPVEVRQEEVESARQRFTLVAPRAAAVEAATFFYPGWTARVDGAPVAASPVPGRGTLRFPVGRGEHRVELELRPTPLRRAALGITLASAALLALGAWASTRRRRREARG